jgi:hypothetical protein
MMSRLYYASSCLCMISRALHHAHR